MPIYSVSSIGAAQQTQLAALANVAAKSTAAPVSTDAATSAGGAGSSGFADTVQQFLNQVSDEYQSTDTAISDILTGKSDNVHGVVLSAARADLSFRMLMEIRNRLIDSYQEIMRMQL